MPTLRWFGRRPVTSRPSMRIAPAVGISKPATMRKVVVLPQPRRAEEGDELAALDGEVELLHHGLLAEALVHVVDLEKRHADFPFDAAASRRRAWSACRGRRR